MVGTISHNVVKLGHGSVRTSKDKLVRLESTREHGNGALAIEEVARQVQSQAARKNDIKFVL